MRVNHYDLLIAYRKAKVDLYYSSNPDYQKIVEYEKNLNINLESLEMNLKSDNLDWITKDFIGSWTINCKSIDVGDLDKCKNTNPDISWQIAKEKKQSKLKVNFRIMEKMNIDIHVLSALWIKKVGEKFDYKLGDNCYGNRIRRDNNGKYNDLSIGSISPYLFQFKKWQKDAYNKIKEEVKKKDLIAITSDVTSFYHNLSPDFLTDDNFLTKLEIVLDDDEMKLTKILIIILNTWALYTPIKQGLPVGLSASAIIANIALYHLDKLIIDDFEAIHYGRYVDDIIIVLENKDKLKCADEVIKYLVNNSKGKLSYTNFLCRSNDFKYEVQYLKKSRICFSNSKNKVLFLNEKSGEGVIQSVLDSMDSQSSEWRELPVIPEDIEEIEQGILSVLNSDGYNATALNQIEIFEVKKTKFAVYLKKIETFERELDPEDWKDIRQKFISTFIDLIITPINIFTFEMYISRVIRIACACNESDYLRLIIEKVLYVIRELTSVHSVNIIDRTFNKDLKNEIIEKWKKELLITSSDAIISSSSDEFIQNNVDSLKLVTDFTIKVILELKKDYFYHDLSFRPFKSIAFKGLFPDRLTEEIEYSKKLFISHEILHRSGRKISSFYREFNGLLYLKDILNIKNEGIPHGIHFPTRPFSVEDLYYLDNSFFNVVKITEPVEKDKNLFSMLDSYRELRKYETLDDIIYSLRGFKILGDLIPKFVRNNFHELLDIPLDTSNTSTKKIAIVSWKTEEDTYYDTIGLTNGNNIDKSRVRRLNRVVNQITKEDESIDYVMLPELAISPLMFYSIARKLKAYNISLISGVDYIKDGSSVANQTWFSLLHYGLTFPSYVPYIQDKQKPAHSEKKNLKGIPLDFVPKRTWDVPPLIKHGSFIFSSVVCSELTNIKYRSDLRGKIDALFIPEWNRDINYFNSLVESAAYDMHAFVIQCNNRKYGDSRIRAPYKNAWEKDIVQVKGGASDFYVIGEINYKSLRSYQHLPRKMNPEFKLLPDGFKLHINRKPPHYGFDVSGKYKSMTIEDIFLQDETVKTYFFGSIINDDNLLIQELWEILSKESKKDRCFVIGIEEYNEGCYRLLGIKDPMNIITLLTSELNNYFSDIKTDIIKVHRESVIKLNISYNKIDIEGTPWKK